MRSFLILLIFPFVFALIRPDAPLDDESEEVDDPTSGRDLAFVHLYRRYKPGLAKTDTVQLSDWQKALPSDTEMSQMESLIKLLYNKETFSELNIDEIMEDFPQLKLSVTVTVYKEDYIVIHEPLNTRKSDYTYPRYFGFAIIAAERVVRHRYHHSAPHFETDGAVCAQAAALAGWTEAKSLVIAGASRFAVEGKYYSPCQRKNALADAAHNTNLMFHTMNVALWEAAKDWSFDNIAPFNDIFIQWHGMAQATCPGPEAFLSIGVDGTHPLYSSSSAFVNRLKTAAIHQAGNVSFADTPKTDTECTLRASTNVFGRRINGVTEGKECTRKAKFDDVKGQFIHIEQKREARKNFTLWRDALAELEEKADEGKDAAVFHPASAALVTVFCLLLMLDVGF